MKLLLSTQVAVWSAVGGKGRWLGGPDGFCIIFYSGGTLSSFIKLDSRVWVLGKASATSHTRALAPFASARVSTLFKRETLALPLNSQSYGEMFPGRV